MTEGGQAGRPTVLAPMQTPASKETGVRIELVAGARYKAIQDILGGRLTQILGLPTRSRRLWARKTAVAGMLSPLLPIEFERNDFVHVVALAEWYHERTRDVAGRSE